MKRFLTTCALAFLTNIAAYAGVEQPVKLAVARQDVSPFAKGVKEFQNVTGAFFYFETFRDNPPAIDFVVESIRLGVMLSNPHGSNLLAGNFEFLGEAFGAGIFDGPGSVMAGTTLIFRYNFIQPHARIIPYFQIGTGLVYTDISENESRGLVSLPVEFNLQGGGGLRYMLDERWSLVVEGGYRHISNAFIKEPNFGVDNFGGSVGFGFSF